MDALNALKAMLPDYAKDVRLTLDSVLARPMLPANEAYGVALAAAVAARSGSVASALRASERLGKPDEAAALAAATVMGMNNAWYSYVDMAEDADFQMQDPGLRMTAYAAHGGVSRRSFELYALSASIVGRCHFCISGHYASLKETGVSAAELREVGRIAAAISAAAQVLAAEGKP